MKIAISTIIDNTNYGNRLQNYATQQVLYKLGHTVETLPKITKINYKLSLKDFLIRYIMPIYSNINFINIKYLNPKLRYYNFCKFTKQYINQSPEQIKAYEDYFKLNDKYDYFLTGSDQVWNYNFRPNLEIDFLQFVDKKKRIAYTPSFGVSSIPKEYSAKYTEYLNDMNYLSVREHAGKKIIKDLTGRDSEVLIDPTMMLNKGEWLQIASKPKCMPTKKYLLTYVLGKQTEEFKAFVNQIAKEKGLEVLNLLNPYDKDIHCINPGEFVYLINHADVMITDSFHGAVFSILMETPFVIFERQDSNVSMNSRIDTLVSTFKMESRLSRHIKSVDDVYNIEFTHIDEILKYEREKAISYLKNSFSIQ